MRDHAVCPVVFINEATGDTQVRNLIIYDDGDLETEASNEASFFGIMYGGTWIYSL